MIQDLLIHGLVYGLVIALMASGLSLIFGVVMIVNFWHGEAYMFGGVVVYFLTTMSGVNYWLALFLAVVTVGAMGWLSDRLIFVRFHGNLLGGLIASVALSIGMMNSAWYILGPIPKAVSSAVTGSSQILGTTISNERLLVVGISIAVISLLIWFIRSTKMGKAMRAVQQDSDAALTLGVSVNRICAMTFGIATGLAALSGGLVAPLYALSPASGQLPLLLAFLTVILGGLGSIMGALIAAIIIGFIYSLSAAFLGMQFSIGLCFAVATVVLIFRPRGLLGYGHV